MLIGLVGLSVLLLADSFGYATAWTTRLGVGAFLVFFSAYDAVAGIATGLAMRNARDLPPAQQEGVWVTVKDWPGFDPAVFSLNVVGTLAWVVAVGALALAARRRGAPRAQWILIGLAALAPAGRPPAALRHDRVRLVVRRCAAARAAGVSGCPAFAVKRSWGRDRRSRPHGR